MQSILSPVILSLRVATISTIITMIVGIVFAYIFVRYNFHFKDLLESVLILPMVLPPSVIGYILLVIFGKRGFIGVYLNKIFGISIIFTWIACVIASVVVSIPLMYQSVKSSFLAIDENYINAARTLGASEKKIFFKVILPLAMPGIVSGTVLSFARALGEFGATMMIAGNIPGKTQTIPTAIYYAIASDDMNKANILTFIVIIFSFSVIFILNKYQKNKKIK
ncbi:MAG: molybdate ABC transporter permease subunit [Peptostreptococcaceae bacterium]|nr:molybdate ABC transporter permease subunit [Peptostreptococcaceae bacterium]